MTKNITLTVGLLCVLSILCFSSSIVQAESPDSLYTVATEKERQGKYAEAKAAYQQIIQQYPNSPAAEDARLRLSRRTALDYLAAGNDAAAQMEIAGAKNNFANHAALPWYLFCIGKRYEELKKYDQAKGLYGQIFQQYPSSPVAEDAGLRLSRRTALDYLAAGNDAAAQIEIAGAKKNFANHTELPWLLYNIANQYKKLKRHEEARGLYGQILQQHPNSRVAEDARMQALGYEVQSLIASGNDVAAQYEITKVKDEFSNNAGLPRLLYCIGKRYEELKKYDQAKGLYGQIFQQYPNSPVAEDAGLRFSRRTALDYLAAGEDTKVDEYVDAIVADFKDLPEVGRSILLIGEEYYLKAQDASGQGNTAVAKAAYEKAIAILETSLDLTSAVPQKCIAYYVTGLCYQQLGNYFKAASAFEDAYAADPKFMYAEYCLFAAGYCNEKLLGQKLVSEAEGRALIRNIYTQFLQTYPDTKRVSYVREWLKNNPE